MEEEDTDGVSIVGNVVTYESEAVAHILAVDAARRLGVIQPFSYASTHHGGNNNVTVRIKKKDL